MARAFAGPSSVREVNGGRSYAEDAVRFGPVWKSGQRGEVLTPRTKRISLWCLAGCQAMTNQWPAGRGCPEKLAAASHLRPSFQRPAVDLYASSIHVPLRYHYRSVVSRVLNSTPLSLFTPISNGQPQRNMVALSRGHATRLERRESALIATVIDDYPGREEVVDW